MMAVKGAADFIGGKRGDDDALHQPRRGTPRWSGRSWSRSCAIRELHQLHLSRLRTTLEESSLLLQKQERGLDGELKTSGWICEQFVRQTLQRYIVPGQFRITSRGIPILCGISRTPNLVCFGFSCRPRPRCCLRIHHRHLVFDVVTRLQSPIAGRAGQRLLRSLQLSCKKTCTKPFPHSIVAHAYGA
jgi:hypothetical protein